MVICLLTHSRFFANMRLFEDRVSGPVAQLVEHRPFKAGVLGSSPSRLTSYTCSNELWVLV